MANIMTKRGQADNIITYEHICDTTEDLDKIDPKYITMGSVAIIISGDAGFEVYMANSKKEWVSLGAAGSGSGSSNSGPESNVVGQGTSGHMIIHDE